MYRRSSSRRGQDPTNKVPRCSSHSQKYLQGESRYGGTGVPGYLRCSPVDGLGKARADGQNVKSFLAHGAKQASQQGLVATGQRHQGGRGTWLRWGQEQIRWARTGGQGTSTCQVWFLFMIRGQSQRGQGGANGRYRHFNLTCARDTAARVLEPGQLLAGHPPFFLGFIAVSAFSLNEAVKLRVLCWNQRGVYPRHDIVADLNTTNTSPQVEMTMGVRGRLRGWAPRSRFDAALSWHRNCGQYQHHLHHRQPRQTVVRGYAAATSRENTIQTFEIPCGSAGTVTVECVSSFFLSIFAFACLFASSQTLCFRFVSFQAWGWL